MRKILLLFLLSTVLASAALAFEFGPGNPLGNGTFESSTRCTSGLLLTAGGSFDGATLALEVQAFTSSDLEWLPEEDCVLTSVGRCKVFVGSGDLRIRITGGTAPAINTQGQCASGQISAADGDGGGGSAINLDWDQDTILNVFEDLSIADATSFDHNDDGTTDLTAVRISAQTQEFRTGQAGGRFRFSDNDGTPIAAEIIVSGAPITGVITPMGGSLQNIVPSATTATVLAAASAPTTGMGLVVATSDPVLIRLAVQRMTIDADTTKIADGFTLAVGLNSGVPFTCDSTKEGHLYGDDVTNELCFCNGTSWNCSDFAGAMLASFSEGAADTTYQALAVGGGIDFKNSVGGKAIRLFPGDLAAAGGLTFQAAFVSNETSPGENDALFSVSLSDETGMGISGDGRIRMIHNASEKVEIGPSAMSLAVTLQPRVVAASFVEAEGGLVFSSGQNNQSLVISDVNDDKLQITGTVFATMGFDGSGGPHFTIVTAMTFVPYVNAAAGAQIGGMQIDVIDVAGHNIEVPFQGHYMLFVNFNGSAPNPNAGDNVFSGIFVADGIGGPPILQGLSSKVQVPTGTDGALFSSHTPLFLEAGEEVSFGLTADDTFPITLIQNGLIMTLVLVHRGTEFP